MPRYEFVEGNSQKFWEIELQGPGFTVKWGRLGTEGQSKDHAFPDEGTAQHEYEKLVRSKEKKGYQLVGEGEGPAEEERTVVRLEDDDRWRVLELSGVKLSQRMRIGGEDDENTSSERYDTVAEAREQFEFIIGRYLKQGMKEVSRETGRVVAEALVARRLTSHPEYEKHCLAQPDDLKPWQIYADWLQEQGDARGELAALFLSKKSAAGWEFLKRHWDVLVGPHSPSEISDFVVSNGFVAGATLKRPNYDSNTDLAELTADLLGRPAGTFISQLRFGLASFESDNDWSATLGSVLEGSQAAHLRKLEFNDYTYQDCEISWTPFGDFSPIWKGLPSLEHLHIRSGGGGNLGTIEHARLKVFIRESGGLAREEVEAIVNAKWPSLERLDLWTGSSGYGAAASVGELRPILEGKGLPNLKHLGIINSELSVELLSEFARCALLPRLTVLDLSKGVLTDADVDALIRLAPAFRHLMWIDLSGNLLEERLDELKVALPNAVLGEQRENYGDEDDRYVAVGE